MKRSLRILALLFLLCLLGCGGEENDRPALDERTSAPGRRGAGKLKALEDIGDKTIGVLTGSVYDTTVARTYPEAKIRQFQTVSDLLVALDTGKIDATFFDQAALPEVLKANPDLGILARDVFSNPIGAGFNKDEAPLREQFNAFLREIRGNGVHADMVRRWMEEGVFEMPPIESTGVNGVLRAGVVNDLGVPFAFLHEGRLVGFDIELSSRFAAFCGRTHEPVPLQFASLIASIVTDKIDIITASMYITEERKKRIDFSDPYYASGASVLVRRDAMDPSVAGSAGVRPPERPFLERLYEGFYSNLILEKRYLMILEGLGVTVLISVSAAILGTLLGGVLCFMKISGRRGLTSVADLYISLLRGTPVLVLLMLLYYVVFASVPIHPLLVSILAFGLNFGAYVSEMFRTSIESVDRGQTEAGIASGFTRIQTFVFIVAPQALKHLLPVYKGEFISLVKMTSIVGYIAVQDLTKAGDIIRSRTFDAFFPLFLAAAIYWGIAWLLTRALSRLEISVDPRRKRRAREAVAAG